MNDTTFKPSTGDTVFGDNGEQGEYVAFSNGVHIVRPMYEGPDDEASRFGRPEEWRNVFETEPVLKAGEEVTRLHAQAETLRAEVESLRGEKLAIDRDYKARMAKLQRHEKLAFLEDFLDGKLTHYAVLPEYSSAPYVLAVGDAKSGDDKWTRDLRLLSLFGRSNGDIAWNLNQYYDGSGSSKQEVVPCRSEEEAKAIIRQRALDTWELWRLDPKQIYACTRIAGAAEKIGFEVPQDVRAAIKAATVLGIESELEKQRNALQVLDQKLANARALPE